MGKDDESLLGRLFVELFQTEESARKHPRIEAERLGDTAPGRAMRVVSDHASRVLPELRRLAAAERLESRSLGSWIGDAFSVARRVAFDRMLDREKSYRGTLIGLYHGVDVVRLLRASARTDGRDRIAAFCDAWLDERIPLIDAAGRQLDWFAEHPQLALESSTAPLRSASPST
jgi:hypothetical protein